MKKSPALKPSPAVPLAAPTTSRSRWSPVEPLPGLEDGVLEDGVAASNSPRSPVRFAHDSTEASGSLPEAAPAFTVALQDVSAEREATFQRQTLHSFRDQLRMVAALSLMLLPLYTLFYAYLSPVAARQVLAAHTLMVAVGLSMRTLARHASRIGQMRAVSLGGYAFFCAGAALNTAMLCHDQPDGGDLVRQAIQFVALAGHAQVMISTLLLPYSVREGATVAALVVASLGWALWYVAPGFDAIYAAQLFVLSTTAFLVLCITHFQSALRRQAFDAAFDLAQAAARLQTLSTHDDLTGGFNRRYLEHLMAGESARAARFGHPLSVLMFDLDEFKGVNDQSGHPRGDEVLREVHAAALATVRDLDTVARYGGDEFLIVLPECDSDCAFGIAQRLQETAHARFSQRWGARPEGQLTLSIGLITLQTPHPRSDTEVAIEPVESIIARVDERLYEAKRGGRNKIAR